MLIKSLTKKQIIFTILLISIFSYGQSDIINNETINLATFSSYINENFKQGDFFTSYSAITGIKNIDGIDQSPFKLETTTKSTFVESISSYYVQFQATLVGTKSPDEYINFTFFNDIHTPIEQIEYHVKFTRISQEKTAFELPQSYELGVAHVSILMRNVKNMNEFSINYPEDENHTYYINHMSFNTYECDPTCLSCESITKKCEVCKNGYKTKNLNSCELIYDSTELATISPSLDSLCNWTTYSSYPLTNTYKAKYCNCSLTNSFRNSSNFDLNECTCGRSYSRGLNADNENACILNQAVCSSLQARSVLIIHALKDKAITTFIAYAPYVYIDARQIEMVTIQLKTTLPVILTTEPYDKYNISMSLYHDFQGATENKFVIKRTFKLSNAETMKLHLSFEEVVEHCSKTKTFSNDSKKFNCYVLVLVENECNGNILYFENFELIVLTDGATHTIIEVGTKDINKEFTPCLTNQSCIISKTWFHTRMSCLTEACVNPKVDNIYSMGTFMNFLFTLRTRGVQDFTPEVQIPDSIIMTTYTVAGDIAEQENLLEFSEYVLLDNNRIILRIPALLSEKYITQAGDIERGTMHLSITIRLETNQRRVLGYSNVTENLSRFLEENKEITPTNGIKFTFTEKSQKHFAIKVKTNKYNSAKELENLRLENPIEDFITLSKELPTAVTEIDTNKYSPVKVNPEPTNINNTKEDNNSIEIIVIAIIAGVIVFSVVFISLVYLLGRKKKDRNPVSNNFDQINNIETPAVSSTNRA